MISLSDSAEVIVIGAGPAGLAAGMALGPKAVVIETGPSANSRRRYDLVESTAGVGGAGLFSDGKFSYRPSASALWKLDEVLLGRAMEWLERTLGQFDIPYSEGLWINEDAKSLADFSKKSYPSYYADPDQRRLLVNWMAESTADLRPGTEAIGVQPTSDGWKVVLADGSVRPDRSWFRLGSMTIGRSVIDTTRPSGS